MNYGRYEIIRELGRGSIGVVYQAHDPKIDRLVAIKILRQDRIINETFVKRFLREAKAAGRLSHPNIVTIFDVAEDQGSIYIAMEFVEGEPLDKVIRDKGFSLEETVNLGIQIAETLDYAHQKGVTHRDIKTSNIIMKPDGQMKITDFGIAHIEDPCSTFQTQDGIILGTPAYMSPEQILGKHVDGRSDIFSLGTILYELGSGKRPFGREGQNLATLFNEIVHKDPPVPAHINNNIPDNLSQIIMRCLNKKPDDRFQTGRDLAEALKSYTQESKSPAPSVKPESFSVKKSRHFISFLLITILLITIIGGFYGFFYLIKNNKSPFSKDGKAPEISDEANKTGPKDINVSANPCIVGSCDTPGTANCVFIRGTYAYVADGDSGLKVIGISDVNNPHIIGSCDTPSNAHSVFVTGNYAYVADGDSGLQIIDISTPAKPSIVGSYNTPGWAWDVFISGVYAYVAHSNPSLLVIDISTPAKPSIVGSYNTPAPGVAHIVFISGAYAYMPDLYEFQVIDISSPTNPSIVGSCDKSAFGGNNGIYINGAYAYVADAYGLQVIDISTPAKPSIVGTWDAPKSACDVFVSGVYAYVTTFYSGLKVIDISAPAKPSIVGICDTPDKAYGVYINGSYAYVADLDSGLQIIDISSMGRS